MTSSSTPNGLFALSFLASPTFVGRRLCFGPRVFIGLYESMYVCMLPTFLKNYLAELHEIFRDDLSSSKDQSIRFWERSGQGQDHEKVKNYWTELHEIFRDDLSSSKDQSIRFGERSGQRSRSRKGLKRIFVITHSVFV